MRAAWYERQGPAADVLVVGEIPLPVPAEGEVRVRLTHSGVNPGDAKKRAGWLGSAMAFPRIVPHSDGSGVIDAAGAGVPSSRVGQRVWVYGAQSYRPFGTAAEATVVPDRLAVEAPDGVSNELGASLGIPGITAHRAVFGDGSIQGCTVLAHGVLGGVGSMAAQLARWRGATVIGSVRRAADVARVPPSVADQVVALDDPDVVGKVRRTAPHGVDRVIEVAMSANVDLDVELVANGAVIAAYASREDPVLPFWPLLFANVTLRMLGSDDFPAEAKQAAAADLCAAAAAGALQVPLGPVRGLDAIAAAHLAVEGGSRGGRVVVATS